MPTIFYFPSSPTCLFTCLRNHQVLSHYLALLLLFPQPWMVPFPTPSLPMQMLYLLHSQTWGRSNPIQGSNLGDCSTPSMAWGSHSLGQVSGQEGLSQPGEKREIPLRERYVCPGTCSRGSRWHQCPVGRVSRGLEYRAIESPRKVCPTCISIQSCDPLGLSSHGVLRGQPGQFILNLHPHLPTLYPYS